LLVQGVSYRSLERRFADEGISDSSFARHHRHHLTPQMAEALAAEERDRGAGLVRELLDLTETTRQILNECQERGDVPGSLAAIRRLERQLEIHGRLIGELRPRDGATVKVAVGINVESVEPEVPPVVRDANRFVELLQELADAGALPEPRRRQLPPADDAEPVEDAEPIIEGEIIPFPPSA
jgi:hypothetical protein